MKCIVSLLKFPFVAALGYGPLRKRIVSEIVQKHYEDLNVVVPLPGGVCCPIVSLEHWVSFDNIFCEREYDRLLFSIPLPRSWLDVGCHAGHFTLRLASLWAESGDRFGWRALLIDADSRSASAVEKIIANNQFELNRIVFLHGAIADRSINIQFSENAYMTSEIVPDTSVGQWINSVAVIHEEAILNRLNPPYDLIKLDIEGAEFDFFNAYTRLLSQSKHVICEWHSWHPGGGGKAQLIKMAQKTNFQLLAECDTERVVQRNGRLEQCGLILLKNNTAR